MDFYAIVSNSSNRKNDGVPPVGMMLAGPQPGCGFGSITSTKPARVLQRASTATEFN